jgi:hypothetical protein
VGAGWRLGDGLQCCANRAETASGRSGRSKAAQVEGKASPTDCRPMWASAVAFGGRSGREGTVRNGAWQVCPRDRRGNMPLATSSAG